MAAFIRIRYVPAAELNGWGYGRGPAYVWECEQCPRSRGVHRFGRWTDRVRSRPAVHPWRRCIDAVDRHVCDVHRGLIRPLSHERRFP